MTLEPRRRSILRGGASSSEMDVQMIVMPDPLPYSGDRRVVEQDRLDIAVGEEKVGKAFGLLPVVLRIENRDRVRQSILSHRPYVGTSAVPMGGVWIHRAAVGKTHVTNAERK